MSKKISTATFRNTMFDQVRAKTDRPIYIVGDYYPGVDAPVGFVATGRGFTATFRHEGQARRAAFLGMARKAK